MNTYVEFALTFLLGCQSGYILTLRGRGSVVPRELDRYLRVIEELHRNRPDGR
jgi:hypothetical protein